jgi:hypothetical protein
MKEKSNAIEVKKLTDVVKLLAQVMAVDCNLHELNWDRSTFQQSSWSDVFQHISVSIERLTTKIDDIQQLTEELMVYTDNQEWNLMANQLMDEMERKNTHQTPTAHFNSPSIQSTVITHSSNESALLIKSNAVYKSTLTNNGMSVMMEQRRKEGMKFLVKFFFCYVNQSTTFLFFTLPIYFIVIS